MPNPHDPTATPSPTPIPPPIGTLGAKVSLINALRCGDGQDELVDWEHIDFDNGPFSTEQVNPSRLTVPVGGDGYYEVRANATFESNAQGARTLTMWLTRPGIGAEIVAWDNWAADSRLSGECGTLLSLAAGDYIELIAWQDSGGNLDLIGQGTTNAVPANMWMVRKS